MSIRKFPFVSDEYYHIYNRGNNKSRIFHDKQDYNRFLKLLYISNSDKNIRIDRLKQVFETKRGERLVSIGAYCLMPNHFHLVIKQEQENGISRFMQKLLTAYSMYYNIKYQRTGTLYEGKFKSQLIEDDVYLKYIFSYVHLNPIKIIEPKWKEVGIKNKTKAFLFLDSYLFSSFKDYNGYMREEQLILDRKAFPDYFPSKKNFTKEILSWIEYKNL